MSRTLEIGQALAAERDLDTLLGLILTHARLSTGADGALSTHVTRTVPSTFACGKTPRWPRHRRWRRRLSVRIASPATSRAPASRCWWRMPMPSRPMRRTRSTPPSTAKPDTRQNRCSHSRSRIRPARPSVCCSWSTARTAPTVCYGRRRITGNTSDRSMTATWPLPGARRSRGHRAREQPALRRYRATVRRVHPRFGAGDRGARSGHGGAFVPGGRLHRAARAGRGSCRHSRSARRTFTREQLRELRLRRVAARLRQGRRARERAHQGEEVASTPARRS